MPDVDNTSTENVSAEAKKSRKAVFRKTIDYNASIINYLRERILTHSYLDRPALQPDALWSYKMLPSKSYLDSPTNCVLSKLVRTSTNKNKCPIYCVCWTPEGRRLITGAFSGEFTLWNGLTFNFETILQAHESQIRCMKWSHNEEWLLTADHSGYVKYWQANMNNVEMYQAHKEPIRGVSFCPFDNKFVTCSDDSTVRIWDFHRCAEERVLRGHGSDVRSVAWHPTLSLLISGSKDAQQPIKLWDPKTGESVTTLYIHKNTCTDVAWNDNGNWFLTASRDHLIKLFDLRNLKSELQTFRGHKRDVMRVAWHPFHECLFASGSADGSIFYWLAGMDTELGAVDNAHESMIWSLAWHPLGHILVSGANDFATKFWSRSRPGDVLKEGVSGGSDGLLQSSAHGTEGETTETLSLTYDLLESLAKTNWTSGMIDINADELAFTTDTESNAQQAEIPGLNEGIVSDLNFNSVDEEGEGDRSGLNKMRSTRSIPKEFIANWASAKMTTIPTVLMMPSDQNQPGPSEIVSAVAAAAVAAVSDFTSAPQYLPPVKPLAPTKKDAMNESFIDHHSSQGVCTRPPRPMNYLGQPPESELEPEYLRGELREFPRNWNEQFDRPPHLPEPNNGIYPPQTAPPPHRMGRFHLDDREPFNQPQHDDFVRRMPDRECHKYGSPHGPPPVDQPPHFGHHAPDMPPHRPPMHLGRERLPLVGDGNPRFPHGDSNMRPSDGHPDRFPMHQDQPPRPHIFQGHMDGPERPWPEEHAPRFGLPHFGPRRPQLMPPHRPPPPGGPRFRPEQGGNFFTQNKRGAPPPFVVNGPPPPELRHKFARPDRPWMRPNQW